MNMTTIIFICPVFKNNYGVHFIHDKLCGVNHNAWYEIPFNQKYELELLLNHTDLLTSIEQLLIGAEIAESVLSISAKGQDHEVEYIPMPDYKKAVITRHGWIIETRS